MGDEQTGDVEEAVAERVGMGETTIHVASEPGREDGWRIQRCERCRRVLADDQRLDPECIAVVTLEDPPWWPAGANIELGASKPRQTDDPPTCTPTRPPQQETAND